ncbi:DUF6428 family protein [Aquimarina sp. ERC-38]|uniref:DUF6428 family protein n=1 Tax=Aquimarina sp. ERC-38 TaxID=2949996 RepID=UPI002247417F|nr:DUF6428 family protein [Aquimarina sp. ERC-38]UZO79468.1 DUF6428 family protein [Aquimarina sp. ERC-38]
MKLSEVKAFLKTSKGLQFNLPDGSLVPEHFHVTEVGSIHKRFIDCGGTLREEAVVNFQLWNADDYNHRLHPEKLLKIIELSEEKLLIGDHEVEVEFQGTTIQKFGLEIEKDHFVLTSKHTDCLAKENCGVLESKPRIRISDVAQQNVCSPNSGCC